MATERLGVIQVSPALTGGGAERVALGLHRGLRRRGVDAWLAVGRDAVQDGDADEAGLARIPRPWPGPLETIVRGGGAAIARPLSGRVALAARLARAVESPVTLREWLDWWLGREPFGYPGTAAIPDLSPGRPDLIHLHNLHGGYFDLRRLPDLARVAPLAMTLHDEWTFTGHCAYTRGCERWRTGCGACPDLAVYPPVRRDRTAGNRRDKARIYAASRLHVSAPSEWLLGRARDSVLAPGVSSWRVIPNGVDLAAFRPGDRAAARARLGLPQEAAILLFVANAARTNPFKDLRTVVDAVGWAAGTAGGTTAGRAGRPLLLVVLGDEGAPEQRGEAEVRYAGNIGDPGAVADHVRAADLYVHAAHADTFPTTVLEALACGTPVVATAVGGIPEQVRSAAGLPGGWSGASFALAEATGVLVPPTDARAMGAAVAALLADDRLRGRLGPQAAADAARRFDLEGQLDATLEWYRGILAAEGRAAT